MGISARRGAVALAVLAVAAVTATQVVFAQALELGFSARQRQVYFRLDTDYIANLDLLSGEVRVEHDRLPFAIMLRDDFSGVFVLGEPADAQVTEIAWYETEDLSVIEIVDEGFAAEGALLLAVGLSTRVSAGMMVAIGMDGSNTAEFGGVIYDTDMIEFFPAIITPITAQQFEVLTGM